METVDEVQKVLAEKEQNFAADPEFLRLREFYEDMKRKGLVKKQEYSVPPLDTAGQQLYRDQQEALQSPHEPGKP